MALFWILVLVLVFVVGPLAHVGYRFYAGLVAAENAKHEKQGGH
jgi:membrane protein required for beta-lactamase induction